MNRWFPRPAREALFAATLAALGIGCSPNNGVKPGAPVLMSLSIVEASGTKTDVTATTTTCITGTKEGDDCDPAAPVCTTDTTVCHCVAKGMDDCTITVDAAMTQGSWVCHYGPQAQVLAVFDRLLDGDLLDGGDGGPRPDVATFGSTPPFAAVSTSTGYTPNGTPVGLIFPLFGFPSGPSLLVSAVPAMPANNAKVTFQLDSTRVLAKDGKTAFTGQGMLQDGRITFQTNAFGVGITVPVAPPPPPPDASTDDAGTDGGETDGAADGGVSDDGGTSSDAATEAGATEGGAPACVPPPPPPAPDLVPPSKDPVTITFNNPVEPTTIGAHISVTVNGTPLAATAYTIDDTMAPTFTLTPMANWPASSTIVITVDATASDALGDQLGAASSASFTTTSGT